LNVDLSDPEIYAKGMPHDVFRALRANEPVAKLREPSGKHYWAVTRYHDVISVLRSPEHFSSALGGAVFADPPPEFLDKLREAMSHRDPPSHTALRRLVSAAFNPRRVAQLEQRIAQRAQELVTDALDKRDIDFATELAGEMPLFVICEILGIPFADRRKLHDLTERMLGTAFVDREASLRDSMDAAETIRAYGQELAHDKLKHPQDDLITDLLHATVDGNRLTDGEFQAFFMLLFNAGSDTVRSHLCLGLDLLLDRPDVVDELRADPSLLPGAIEEMLRFESPVIAFRRTATRDLELAGSKLAAGDKVMVYFPSANRDETVFDAPDRFDIRRTGKDHIAFGYGAHYCLGAPLARMESKSVFGEMLRRIGRIERVGPLVAARTNFIRGMKSLPIRVER
jgi:cytochrome P450